MNYELLAARLFSAAALFINLRCEYLILDVRSKRLLAFCTVSGLLINEIGYATGVPGHVALVVFNPLVTIVAPIVLSRGPLHVRIARVVLVNLTSLLSEVACMLCYLFLEGETMYRTITAENFPHIIAAYMAGTLVQVLVIELIIARLRNTDPAWEAQLEFPILAFIAGTYAFLSVSIFRFGQNGSQNLFVPLLILVVAALSIALCFTLQRIAQAETMHAREAADRAVTLRQTRHVRQQIEASATRVLHLRRLRHDLANQIGVVVELARADHLDEADRYLAELLERSHDLTEAAHE